MPFEPQHPGSDRPEDEFFSGHDSSDHTDGHDHSMAEETLPCELLILGEQLRDDALHLAEKYPAPSTDPLSSDSSQRLLEATQNKVELIALQHSERRTRRSISKFAGSMIGLSLVVLMFGFSWMAYRWTFQNDQRRSAAIEHQKAAVEIAIEPSSSAATSPIDQIVPLHLGTDENHIEALPAVFLQEVSVPEMEGLFDLWEQEPPARARLSI